MRSSFHHSSFPIFQITRQPTKEGEALRATCQCAQMSRTFILELDTDEKALKRVPSGVSTWTRERPWWVAGGGFPQFATGWCALGPAVSSGCSGGI